MNLKPQPRPHLEKIGKYSAGKSAKDFQKRGKSFLVKLSSNEATWGPSPQAVDALKAKFGEQIIHRGLTGGENLPAARPGPAKNIPAREGGLKIVPVGRKK